MSSSGIKSLHLKDLFSDIFRKHSKTEIEDLFICGTEKTTPSERSMIASWPKPWLHSRIFAVLAVLSILVLATMSLLSDSSIMPALIVFSSVTVSFSLMVFFWECNVPRNISIFYCVVLFLIGGIVLTFLSELIPITNVIRDQTVSYILLAVYQEILQTAVILFFIMQKRPRYILNGICIGAAVSCGFACYLFMGNLYFYNADQTGALILDGQTLHFFYQLALMSAARLLWGVMEGAGLAAASDGKPFELSMLKDIRFLRMFIAAVVLHSLYFLPFTEHGSIRIIKWAFLILSFAIVLTQLSAGLRQAVSISNAAWEADAALTDELEE